MIHDAFMEVTCDGDKCGDAVNVAMEFVYRDYTGENGYYDHADDSIESKLVEDHEWKVADGDDGKNKHYCCEDCAGHTE